MRRAQLAHAVAMAPETAAEEQCCTYKRLHPGACAAVRLEGSLATARPHNRVQQLWGGISVLRMDGC